MTNRSDLDHVFAGGPYAVNCTRCGQYRDYGHHVQAWQLPPASDDTEPADNCEGQDAAEDECTARSRCVHQSGHGTGRWAHCAIPGCSNYLNICPVHEGTP